MVTTLPPRKPAPMPLREAMLCKHGKIHNTLWLLGFALLLLVVPVSAAYFDLFTSSASDFSITPVDTAPDSALPADALAPEPAAGSLQEDKPVSYYGDKIVKDNGFVMSSPQDYSCDLFPDQSAFRDWKNCTFNFDVNDTATG